nr:ATP-grasp domain-containing protein [Candidatus Sigynarchaeota archaeon]
AYSDKHLENFLVMATRVSKEHPVVISKFIEDAREVEVDGVCDGEDVLIGAVIEHVEDAGVHSGDATMSIPPHSLSESMIRKVAEYSKKIARALNIRGPFNIQYLVKNGEAYVIECNLRASRSMPFVSKTKGINLMERAAAVMLGKKLKDINALHAPEIHHTGIKVPQFSFMRLEGADPVLGVEMVSTGEVACLGESFDEAFLKALLAAEFKVPLNGGNVLISVGGRELKEKLLPLARELSEMGYTIYATEHTAEAFMRAGLDNVKTVYKMRETKRKPNIRDYLINRKIDLVINIVRTGTLEKYAEMMTDEYIIRRKAIEYNIPVITNLKMASALVKALRAMKNKPLTVKSLNEYIEQIEKPSGALKPIP